jgi:hypothetical protein
MGYYVGDIPGQPLIVDPVRNDEQMDLSYFDNFAATLYDPEGTLVALTLTATLDTDTETLTIGWPATSPFSQPGVHILRIVGTATGVRELLPLVRITVDAVNDGWYTLETAREEWRDAPSYDATLWNLLWSSRGDVLAYAPALADGARPPVHYVRSQLTHARNKWNAGKVDPANGSLGDDTFAIRPFPLDWAIKQDLRPKRAVPEVL